MFRKFKKTAALLVIVGALAGCATQPHSGDMNMGCSMCRKMMEQGKCCCKDMQDMKSSCPCCSGMMKDGKLMQCMPKEESKAAAPVVEETKIPDAEEHKAHHPGKTQ